MVPKPRSDKRSRAAACIPAAASGSSTPSFGPRPVGTSAQARQWRLPGHAITREQNAPSFLLLFCRLLVGATFLVAAVPKIRAPGVFADAVRAYHLLPAALVQPFAYALPWIELLVAIYLLLGFMSRSAAAGATALLAMFEVALITSLAHGTTNHSCGCFSGAGSNPLISLLSGGSTIGWWDVIRDALLVAASLAVALWGAGAVSVEALGRRGGRGTRGASSSNQSNG